MLQAMRSGAHSHIIKFVLFGFLVLGVSGLVLMDVGGVFRGGVASNDVAKIGRETIDIRRFDRSVTGILRQQGLDPQLAYKLGYIHQILMSEVQDRMLRRKAQELGIMVSDKQVASQIARLVEPLTDESTTPRQALDRVLMSQGISERQFVNTIRQEMTNTLLRQALLAGARIVPDPLARDLYAFNNETRKIEYLTFNSKDIKDVPEPTDEEIATYYEAVKESYAVPEQRDLTIALIDPEGVEETIGITDDELQAIYEESLAYFEAPEQRIIEQAIVSSQDDAQAIHEKAKKGTPLKQAVKDVTGSEENYLGTETFEREGLVDTVAEAAFSAESGSIAEPVETALGWHVLKVTEVIEPKVTPFEEVKEDLRAERLQTLMADQLFEQANLVDDMIAGGAPLEDAIEEYALNTVRVEDVSSSGMNTDSEDRLEAFANDRELILETGFSLMEGEVAPVVELSDGRFVFIRADDVQPRSYKPLAEVKADVTGKWRERAQRLAAAAKADEAHMSLQDGKSVAEIANDFGLKTQKATITRTGEDSPLPPQPKAEFFAVEMGKEVLASSNGGLIVGRVTGIALPDPSKATEEELSTLALNLARQLPGEIVVSLVGKLAEDYKLKVNEDLLRRAYGEPVE